MASKTTSTQESKPPAWAAPLFQQSASEASKLYNSGQGGNPYMGSTVANLSGTTMGGVNQLAQAGQNWNTSGTRPLFQGIGAGAVSNPFINKLSGVAGGVKGGQTNTSGIVGGQTDVSGINAQNVSGADYRGVLNRAQAPTSAATNLQGYASGANLNGEGNPFYRQRMEGDLADAAAQVRSSMSGMGRSGGGAETRALTDRLGQMRLEGLENDWNREQANQFNAVGMIDAANQGALGTQLGAASGIAGIGAGNADRSLQAGVSRAGFDAADLDRGLQAGVSRAGFQAGDLDRAIQAAGLQGDMLSNAGNMYSTGIGQAQTAANSMADMDQQQFQNQLTGAGATLQAGGLLDSQANKMAMEEAQRFYEMDNAGWNRLGLLQSAAAGAAGPYGSQSGSSRTSNPGAILGGLGSMMGGK